jgi:hypothetical protein
MDFDYEIEIEGSETNIIEPLESENEKDAFAELEKIIKLYIKVPISELADRGVNVHLNARYPQGWKRIWSAHKGF